MNLHGWKKMGAALVVLAAPTFGQSSTDAMGSVVAGSLSASFGSLQLLGSAVAIPLWVSVASGEFEPATDVWDPLRHPQGQRPRLANQVYRVNVEDVPVDPPPGQVFGEEPPPLEPVQDAAPGEAFQSRQQEEAP